MRVETFNNLTFYNCDNMEIMKNTPDNYYSLAIVDPPYGIGISSNPVRQMHKKKKWDNTIPNKAFFKELIRVSKEQIIWGGNYFPLPPSQGFLIWDKKQPQDFSLAMCEMAWSSIQSPAKIFRYSVLTEKGKIHPTQKPIQLYKWLLKNYAKQGDKILDTHLGSNSIGIAIDEANQLDKMNFQFTGIELDEEYFEKSIKRFKEYKSQYKLF